MDDKRKSLSALEQDLRTVFGSRLQSIVLYGLHAADAHGGHGASGGHHHEPTLTHSLVTVESLSAGDLQACARYVGSWHDAGLATPLIVAGHEFGDSLDAFPFEFGEIIADHVLWCGPNPFEGLQVNAADLRRACEVQARSHLLHLRQGFIETGGNANGLAVMTLRSAAPLGALVRSAARLTGSGTHDAREAAKALEHAAHLEHGALGDVVAFIGQHDIPSGVAVQLFPRYLEGMERLTRYIDGWTAQ